MQHSRMYQETWFKMSKLDEDLQKEENLNNKVKEISLLKETFNQIMKQVESIWWINLMIYFIGI